MADLKRWEVLRVKFGEAGQSRPIEVVAAEDYDTLAARCAALEAERSRAMAVLAPSMPESGLEDACRQVKQAAISAAGNCEDLEQQVDALGQALAELVGDANRLCDRCLGGTLEEDCRRSLGAAQKVLLVGASPAPPTEGGEQP